MESDLKFEILFIIFTMARSDQCFHGFSHLHVCTLDKLRTIRSMGPWTKRHIAYLPVLRNSVEIVICRFQYINEPVLNHA